jgi:translocation and assembly module TamB
MLLGVVGFCLALSMAFIYVAYSPNGVAFLVRQMDHIRPGFLQVGRIDGIALRRLSLDDVRVTHERFALAIDHLDWDFTPTQWWRGQIKAHQIHVNMIELMTVAMDDKKDPRTPNFMGIPYWDMAIESLQVGGLTINKKFIFADLNAHYAYVDHQHDIQIKQMTLPMGDLQAALKMAAYAPFKIKGNLSVSGVFEDYPWVADAVMSGGLSALKIDAVLKAKQMAATLDTVVKPFEPLLFNRLGPSSLRLENLNPQIFSKKMPIATLDLALESQGQGTHLVGGLSVVNRQAGRSQDHKIPANLGVFEFDIEGNRFNLLNTYVRLINQGQITGSGWMDKEAMAFDWQLDKLSLADFYGSYSQPIKGLLALTGSLHHPHLDVNLSAPKTTLQGAFNYQSKSQLLHLNDLKLTRDAGFFLINGDVDFQSSLYDVEARLKSFNPQMLVPRLPTALINADFLLKGGLGKKNPSGDVALSIKDSVWAGSSLSANIQSSWANRSIPAINGSLTVGDNQLKINGSLGRASDQLNLQLVAKQLQQLNLGVSGDAVLDLAISGLLTAPLFHLEGASNQLKMGALSVAPN